MIGWLLLGLLAIFAAYCLLLAVSALLVSTKKEYRHDSPFYRWLLDSSIRLAVPILRIHMDVHGLELLPQGTPVFFVGNHRSNFDPILTWYVLRKYRIGYLSKAENFRIPLYGRIIRRCGVGIARTGAYTGHGSGEIMIGFTTANRVDTKSTCEVEACARIKEEKINEAFEAAAEAVEEAILNSMVTAKEKRGLDGARYRSLAEFLEKPGFLE